MLGQLNTHYTQRFAKKCKLASKSKINVFLKKNINRDVPAFLIAQFSTFYPIVTCQRFQKPFKLLKNNRTFNLRFKKIIDGEFVCNT